MLSVSHFTFKLLLSRDFYSPNLSLFFFFFCDNSHSAVSHQVFCCSFFGLKVLGSCRQAAFDKWHTILRIVKFISTEFLINSPVSKGIYICHIWKRTKYGSHATWESTDVPRAGGTIQQSWGISRSVRPIPACQQPHLWPKYVEVHMSISSLGNALILFQPLYRMDVVLLGYHSKYFNI